MAQQLLVYFTVFAISACSIIRSSEDGSTFTRTAVTAPSSEQQILTDACSYSNDHCDNLWSPSLCLLNVYNRQELGHGHALYSWGDSPCLATKGLRKQFCDNDWDPNLADVPVCLPDPSESECQDIESLLTSCTTEGPETRLFCYAASYGGSSLSAQQHIPGWGVGRCEALKDLYQRACKLHLRPTQVGTIKCEVDKNSAECPAAWELCPDTYDPRQCLLEASQDNNEINVVGVNLCQARNSLRYKLCQSNTSPALATKAKCQQKPR